MKYEILSLIIGASVYMIAGFSYSHATFLTRSEANVRKESRDKSEDAMVKSLDRIERKLNRVLGIKEE